MGNDFEPSNDGSSSSRYHWRHDLICLEVILFLNEIARSADVKKRHYLIYLGLLDNQSGHLKLNEDIQNGSQCLSGTIDATNNSVSQLLLTSCNIFLGVSDIAFS